VLLVIATAAESGSAPAAVRADITTITHHRAASHPMRYHLALPPGWKAGREWPVLVVIPDAARDFEANLKHFVGARGSRPYILVAPEVLSCGGARSRTLDRYSYARTEWDSLQGGDDFAFEDAGLAAVLAEVHARWHGEPRAFLTGWEAGGHTVWAQAMRHPERWCGVVPVTPNYQRRGLDSSAFSRAPERTSLPIQVLRCGAPTADSRQAVAAVESQIALALGDARDHGFPSRLERVVPGMDHGPLPGPVLDWCDSLRSR
jgi:dienelactone hydrolase